MSFISNSFESPFPHLYSTGKTKIQISLVIMLFPNRHKTSFDIFTHQGQEQMSVTELKEIVNTV